LTIVDEQMIEFNKLYSRPFGPIAPSWVPRLSGCAFHSH